MEARTGGVLIIDNYDSFTHNIREALAKLGIDAVIRRNDEISIDQIRAMNPDYIIISPGPGTPEHPEDIGVTDEAIDYAIAEDRPLLGVCLGHQALAHHFGGRIVRAETAMHGKTSRIHAVPMGEDAKSNAIFDGVSDGTEVMRYHSLVADRKTFPDELVVTASTEDGVIMGLQHGKHDLYGVQFHPESFKTPEGPNMLENFLRVRADVYAALSKKGISEESMEHPEVPLPDALRECIDHTDIQPFTVCEFPCELAPEEVYARLHGASDHAYCFESLRSDGGERAGVYSYFGADPAFVLSARNEMFLLNGKEVVIGDEGNPLYVFNAAIETMRRTSKNLPVNTDRIIDSDQHLSGGFVGYMSFEAMRYLEPKAVPESARTPDGEHTFSYGYFEDGLIFDSTTGKYQYYTRGRDRFDHFREILARESGEQGDPKITKIGDAIAQEEFEANVRSVQEHILDGDTFQTVISRREQYGIDGSMVPLYARLRQVCPSGNMHAIKMGDAESIGSFPELTLSIDGEVATTFQVAGTIARTFDAERDAALFDELRNDPKERAEHIMLVDLARNDLARGCKPGTQRLDALDVMQRLDAGPVMHMASRVTGDINGMSPLMTLAGVIPMGTTSGAPKDRSVQIMYAQERGQPRGLYGGTFGGIDLRGNVEAVVGLRSIMRIGKTISVQAGAGVVKDSIPAKEFEETEQKMGVPRKTLQPFLTS